MHVTLLDVSLWVLASWLKEVLNCFSALLKPYIGNAGSNKSNVNTSSSHPVKYSEFQLLRYITIEFNHLPGSTFGIAGTVEK